MGRGFDIYDAQIELIICALKYRILSLYSDQFTSLIILHEEDTDHGES